MTGPNGGARRCHSVRGHRGLAVVGRGDAQRALPRFPRRSPPQRLERHRRQGRGFGASTSATTRCTLWAGWCASAAVRSRSGRALDGDVVRRNTVRTVVAVASGTASQATVPDGPVGARANPSRAASQQNREAARERGIPVYAPSCQDCQCIPHAMPGGFDPPRVARCGLQSLRLPVSPPGRGCRPCGYA
jgi:hypothetical protein